MRRRTTTPVPPAWRPDRHDHAHALRLAIALALAGTALLATGRPELLVYAVFGSFAGMYGRYLHGWARSRAQLRGGVLLCAAIAIGVVLAHLAVPGVVLVLTETVFAAGASLLADRWRLRPSGPFFAIFALGATALVPAQVAPISVALAVGVGTALLAVLIGAVAAGPATAEVVVPAPYRPVAARIHALRYLVAVGTAGGLGLALGLDHANWAMAAAAVPLAAIDTGAVSSTELRGVLRRAGHRIAGTLAGLAATAALLPLNLGESELVLVILLLVFPTELFMTRHYGLAIGFFTPLIMAMTQLSTPMPPGRLLAERTLDTLIGVACGVAAALWVRGPSRRWIRVDPVRLPPPAPDAAPAHPVVRRVSTRGRSPAAGRTSPGRPHRPAIRRRVPGRPAAWAAGRRVRPRSG
ncbi:hypothetical protein GOHSU_28_00595 [Gordonia hirsuta DSM 44140 = NBRC 16056]|uniref:Integral membrane bound transporter domain-containing protein n=1 Tax=Gordonia hirsuta DSM 44140 = NBRC 16056 TaxID=1121927 RepID=L7LAT6_9ACTN|nr:hypothetical protein GOHSU_28_00595 [Gordonia hirsuta DSM 44140 = NBRC 16056]